MEELKKHWTAQSTRAFVHRISFDFVTQLEKRLEETKTTKKQFAKALKVTPSRVSQVFNDPGNLGLESAVQYALAAGLKVSLIAYDDGDPSNNSGPVNPEIFEQCWKLQGAPTDFFELAEIAIPQTCRISLFHATASTAEPWNSVPINAQQLLCYAANTRTEITN